MLFACITDPGDITRLPEGVDGIEILTDLFPDVEFARHVLATSRIPVMISMRGNAGEEFLHLGASFIDVPYNSPLVGKAFQTGAKIVLSYHGPFDESVYEAMSKYPAWTYKIASPCRTTTEALKHLMLVKSHPNVSAICMGEVVTFARVLGPIVGNKVDYSYISKPTAPGQLTAHEFLQLYRYHSLNRDTAVYGVIGEFVITSLGPQFHNPYFGRMGWNAVYVRMPVVPHELDEFMSLIGKFNVKGLCVSMPFKEKILPGVINMMTFDPPTGFNTDGIGAVNAMGEVEGKHIVLLGAGGTAFAIATEAKRKGARVSIWNRTLERAQKLAENVGVSVVDKVPTSYDIIVNCTPTMPIDPRWILPTATAMDVVYVPRVTEFLKAALAKGCQVIYGEEMFVELSVMKWPIWCSRS